MIAKSITVFLFCAVSAWTAVGQEVIAGFTGHEFRPEDGVTPMPYRLFTPEMKEGEKYPLVIFLHGAGKSQGADNKAQMIPVVKTMGSDKVQGPHPSFVVAPQCPKNDSWLTGKIYPGYERFEAEAAAAWVGGGGNQGRREKLWELSGDTTLYFPLDPFVLTRSTRTVLGLIDHFIANYPVDPDRVYVMGGSMGGYGTWAVGMNIPEKLAAIVPLQGAGDPSNVEPLKDMPIWISHGDADTSVPVRAAREMYKALRDAGNKKVVYVEFPGVRHGQLLTVALEEDSDKNGETDIIEWMFRQNRKERK